VEDDLGARGFEALHDDGGAGEGGVAAERDLGGGREPAEVVVAAEGDEVGGFGEVVFGGDGLEDGVGEKGVEGNDGGGIAGEAAGSEGVDLVDGGAHKKILAEA
jgi:hypothetical protein